MERVSINEVSTFQWNFLEDITRYSTLGFVGIGVWRHKISDFCDHTVSDMLRNAGLKVSSLQWVGGFTGNDCLSFSEAIDDAHAAIRSAGILQADCLIVHPGAANGHTRNHARRLLHAAMNELVPIAQDYGVRLALEPMPIDGGTFTFLEQIREALEFVIQYPSTQLGLVLDLYGLPTVFDSDTELWKHVDRVALVQLADRRCDDRGQWSRCLPGLGTAGLVDWIRCLEQAEYRGFYEVEIVGDACAATDGFRLLHDLAQSLPLLFEAARTRGTIQEPRVATRPSLY